jgi:hypothetical protein
MNNLYEGNKKGIKAIYYLILFKGLYKENFLEQVV